MTEHSQGAYARLCTHYLVRTSRNRVGEALVACCALSLLAGCGGTVYYKSIRDDAYAATLSDYLAQPGHKSLWWYELGESTGYSAGPRPDPVPPTVRFPSIVGVATRDIALVRGKQLCDTMSQIDAAKQNQPIATPCILLRADEEVFFDISSHLHSNVQKEARGAAAAKAEANAAEMQTMMAITAAGNSRYAAAAAAMMAAQPAAPASAAASAPTSSAPARGSAGSGSARQPTTSAPSSTSKAHLRVDHCIKFEVKATPSMYGDATVTNICSFEIQYEFCYQGGTGQSFDCVRPTGSGGAGYDRLKPGEKQDLPEYKRARNTGLNAVACRGGVGDVMPQVMKQGRTGCF